MVNSFILLLGLLALAALAGLRRGDDGQQTDQRPEGGLI